MMDIMNLSQLDRVELSHNNVRHQMDLCHSQYDYFLGT